jgi:hypothetical protein
LSFDGLATLVKRILEALPKSPRFKLAGFFTHSVPCPEDSARPRNLFNRWAGKCIVSFEKVNKEKQLDFKEYFNCEGAFSYDPRIHKEGGNRVCR